MSKHLLALAVTAALSVTVAGCSDSGGGDDNGDGGNVAAGGGAGAGGGGTNAGGGGGGTNAAPISPATAPSGAGAPSGDTKAGIYTGDFGFGDGFEQGVFIVDNGFNLTGLALATNGSAKSVFGALGAADTFQGTIREYDHAASQSTASANSSFGVSGADATLLGPFGLSFTNGTSIEGSTERGVALSSAGAIAPATIQSVAGTWTAENRYADCEAAPADPCQLQTSITFSGTDVTGSTNIANPASGLVTYENPIQGQIAEFGQALLVNLNWGTPDNGNENPYRGAVFFDPATGDRLVFVVEARTEAGEVIESANPKVLTAVMTRSQ